MTVNWIQFLRTVVLSHPQFLATWALLTWPFASLKPAREKEPASKTDIATLCSLTVEVAPLAIVCWLEASNQATSLSRVAMWIIGSSITGTHLRVCLLLLPTTKCHQFLTTSYQWPVLPTHLHFCWWGINTYGSYYGRLSYLTFPFTYRGSQVFALVHRGAMASLEHPRAGSSKTVISNVLHSKTRHSKWQNWKPSIPSPP